MQSRQPQKNKKLKKHKRISLTKFFLQRILWLMPLTVGLLTAYALSK